MGNTLVALGCAFLAAGVFARFGRRLGLPTIPLFMIAGIILGPHTPGVTLVEDPADVELLAVLGLVMLLFNLGLEFSFDDLVGGGRRLLAVGGIYLLLNIGGGLVFGFALGWGSREALVIAGAVGISSSAIVTKLLTELHRLANPESRLVLGIIVVEDVFLALYLAVLQPVIGDARGAAEIVGQFLLSFGFLVAMAALARFGARLVGRLFAHADDELLTVCFVGVAILGAGVAEELGVSDAIGAFMVGLVFAGTAARSRIERLVIPLRDAFGSVFFFAFGLTIDLERGGHRRRAGDDRDRAVGRAERRRGRHRGAHVPLRPRRGRQHRVHCARARRAVARRGLAGCACRLGPADRTVRRALRARARAHRARALGARAQPQPLASCARARRARC